LLATKTAKTLILQQETKMALEQETALERVLETELAMVQVLVTAQVLAMELETETVKGDGDGRGTGIGSGMLGGGSKPITPQSFMASISFAPELLTPYMPQNSRDYLGELLARLQQ
jgi:hypothetical protein